MLNKFVINANNLIYNANQVKKDNPNSLICAMVKANAYGVGQKEVVKTLSSIVNFFGVATIEEAKEISKFTNKKILIVGYLEHLKKVDNRFSYACHSLQDIEYLIKLNTPINIHIKINSGMNRYGISSKEEFKKILQAIKNSKLNFEGLFTHFATADNYVNEQMRIFEYFVNLAKTEGFNPLIHVDNSFVNEKFNHHKAMVRIGFDLYNRNSKKFKPVVSIKSKIVQINNCKCGDLIGYNYRCVATNNVKVAVIPVGYADGFSISYIGANLMFKGKKCKVLNVCMDCFMLDVSKVNVKKGDNIFILNKNNPLSIYAKHSNFSEYEVMTNFSHIRAHLKLISASKCKNKQN